MSQSPMLSVGHSLALQGLKLDADPFADPLVIQNFKFSLSLGADMLHMSTEVIASNEAARLEFIQAKTRLDSLVLLIKHEIVHLENELQEILDEMTCGVLTNNEIQGLSLAVAPKAQLISQKNRAFRGFQKELCDLGQEPAVITSCKTFVYHIPHGQLVDLTLPDGEVHSVIFIKAGVRSAIGPEGPF